MRYLFIIFLLLCQNVFAQNIQITNKSQHPYRHIPTDLNSTNTPSANQCPTYNSTTKTFTWASCSGGGGTIDGAGTANYISKWQDSDTLTDSIVFDNGTNIGIGTTTPIAKLTVNGDLFYTSIAGTRFFGIGQTSTSSIDGSTLDISSGMSLSGGTSSGGLNVSTNIPVVNGSTGDINILTQNGDGTGGAGNIQIIGGDGGLNGGHTGGKPGELFFTSGWSFNPIIDAADINITAGSNPYGIGGDVLNFVGNGDSSVNNGQFKISRYGSGIYAIIDIDDLSSDRTYTLQDDSGTVAFLSDIPSFTAAGNLYNIQYNDPLGSFAGSDNFKFDGNNVSLLGYMNIGTLPLTSGLLRLQESVSIPVAISIRNRNSTQDWLIYSDTESVDDGWFSIRDDSSGVGTLNISPGPYPTFQFGGGLPSDGYGSGNLWAGTAKITNPFSDNIALSVESQSLTTGKVAYFSSYSDSTDTRNLVEIINGNSAATNTTILDITQEASADIIQVHQNREEGTGLTITGNSLSTGSLANFTSSSNSVGTRSLVNITNSNVSSVSTTAITVTQESDGKTIFLDANGADSITLDIDSEATTGTGINVSPAVMTTGTALNIPDADALTTGTIANFTSASASTATRRLVKIINDDSAAVGTIPLLIQQDAGAPALVTTNGNVGIGTTAPSTNLHVVGGARITGLNCTGNTNGGTVTADANGVLSCTDDDSGAGTPGGVGTQIQFNDSGSFSGDSGFVYNKTTDTATLGNLTLTNPLTANNGGTGQVGVTDDTVLVGNGINFVAKSLSDCQDSSGNHLNYTASTNSFSCGTSDSNSGTVTSVTAAFPIKSTGGTTPVISIGVASSSNGALGFTGVTDDTIAIADGSFWRSSSLSNCADSAGNHLNYTASTNTFSCGTSTSGVPTTRNINTTSPLAGGGSLSGDLTLSLNVVPTTKGAIGFTGVTDDTTIIADGSAWKSTALPTTGTNGCSGTSDKLLYNTATNSFSCGSDQTSSVSGFGTRVVFMDGNNTLGSDSGFVYNKTTDSVTIAGGVNANSFDSVYITQPGSSSTLTVSSDTTLVAGGGNTISVQGSGTNTFTFPSASDTLVGRNSTDTLTNKTITSPIITPFAQVSSSDVTTTSTSLVDITGLSISLGANQVWEFEANLSVASSSTAGNEYAVQYSAVGATVEAQVMGTNAATTFLGNRLTAFNTKTANSFCNTTTSTTQCVVYMHGLVTVGANAGNLTIQHNKDTSGTATVRIGSTLRAWRVQ